MFGDLGWVSPLPGRTDSGRPTRYSIWALQLTVSAASSSQASRPTKPIAVGIAIELRNCTGSCAPIRSRSASTARSSVAASLANCSLRADTTRSRSGPGATVSRYAAPCSTLVAPQDLRGDLLVAAETACSSHRTSQVRPALLCLLVSDAPVMVAAYLLDGIRDTSNPAPSASHQIIGPFVPPQRGCVCGWHRAGGGSCSSGRAGDPRTLATAVVKMADGQDCTVGRRVDMYDMVRTDEIAERLRLAQTQPVPLWRRRYPHFWIAGALAQLRRKSAGAGLASSCQ